MQVSEKEGETRIFSGPRPVRNQHFNGILVKLGYLRFSLVLSQRMSQCLGLNGTEYKHLLPSRINMATFSLYIVWQNVQLYILTHLTYPMLIVQM